MKIDHEYLKQLLLAFESSEQVFTDIDELAETGFSYEDEKFTHHMILLDDYKFIESPSNGIGYQMLSSGQILWASHPLRMTALGHEYLAAIKEPDVWSKIVSSFSESSLDTVKTVAKELVVGIAKKKVNDLIGS